MLNFVAGESVGMNTTRVVAVVSVLLLVVAGAGTVSAAPSDENPACDSPSHGFDKSVEASDGVSLDRAGPGLVNARTKIGCEDVVPS
jgi:hypothetical protein